jgi:NAD(P)H-hydrate epimerase
VLVVGGSPNYVGAAALAAQGAGRVGAGLVTVATATALQPIIAAKVSEATFLPLPEAEPGVLGSEAIGSVLKALDGYRAFLIGPGLGQDPATATFVRAQLGRWPEAPVVWMPTASTSWRKSRAGSSADRRWRCDSTPWEMARLLRTSVEGVQANRLGVAREAATRWNKTVVLKGAYT